MTSTTAPRIEVLTVIGALGGVNVTVYLDGIEQPAAHVEYVDAEFASSRKAWRERTAELRDDATLTDVFRAAAIAAREESADSVPDYESAEPDDCARCSDAALYLSSDGLCDGCVEEVEAEALAAAVTAA